MEIAPPDRRLDTRKSVIWNARLRRDGSIFACEVFDVSSEGAKARIVHAPPIDATVVLEIDRLGMFCGEIRWRTANQIGIRFLESASSIEARLRDASLGLDGET
ncbi:MAG: PilZ domain-containing protein [Geminicoccaceae bacterium]